MKIATYSALLPYVLISPEEPGTVTQEKWERITVLFNTRPGTQALDREYGVAWPIDELTPVAQARCEQEVIQKMRLYIAGTDVRDTGWRSDAEGRNFMEVMTYEY